MQQTSNAHINHKTRVLNTPISQNINLDNVTRTTATVPRGARKLATYMKSKDRIRINHTHKFTFMNQSGKRSPYSETKHRIGMALLSCHGLQSALIIY